jgi:hypothetical protein
MEILKVLLRPQLLELLEATSAHGMVLSWAHATVQPMAVS